MRVWIKRIAIAICVIIAVVLIVGFWALRQTRQVPEFYTKAVQQSPEQTAAVSQHLQEEVEQLAKDAGRLGSWRAAFSDQKINAWLIEELPRRFPKMKRRGVSDPRIAIEDGRLCVAARYKDKRFDTVISCEIEVELTEEPNMLALQLTNLRAGALPLPLDQFLKGITKEASNGGIDVRWDMTDAGPIALVTVPREHPKYVRSPVIVESVEFANGELQLSGHTGELAEESFVPRGRVHQFVSFRPKRNSQRSSPGRSLGFKMR